MRNFQVSNSGMNEVFCIFYVKAAIKCMLVFRLLAMKKFRVGLRNFNCDEFLLLIQIIIYELKISKL